MHIQLYVWMNYNLPWFDGSLTLADYFDIFLTVQETEDAALFRALIGCDGSRQNLKCAVHKNSGRLCLEYILFYGV